MWHDYAYTLAAVDRRRRLTRAMRFLWEEPGGVWRFSLPSAFGQRSNTPTQPSIPGGFGVKKRTMAIKNRFASNMELKRKRMAATMTSAPKVFQVSGRPPMGQVNPMSVWAGVRRAGDRIIH